jgi:hypothetical protein
LPTPEQGGLLAVVEEAWRGGFSIQGDFFRRFAPYCAMAASLALITTREEAGLFGRRWRVTNKGLRWLNEMKETKCNTNR